MKILQLCKKFPFPLKDGESIAVTYLSQSLQQLGCELTLLTMNTTKHPFDIETLPDSFNHYKDIHIVDIDNRVKIKDAFTNLFSPDSYHVSRFISEKFRKKLAKVLRENEFDVIQLETLYLAPYIETIRQHSSAIISQRSHNVEFEIWERVTSNTKFGLKKWYLGLLTKRLEAFELAQLNKYDSMVAITDRDLEEFKRLGCSIDSIVCPIGLDMEVYNSRNYPFNENFSLSFIGSLDWMPNLEGITWFLEKVWLQAKDRMKDIELHVAGRNTPDWLLSKNIQGVTIHGEVESALDFVGGHNIMIAPLFSGGGMKVKILEGMALGRTVITTDIGNEGIHAIHNENILIANSPEEFLSSLSWVMANPDEARKLGAKAKMFVRGKFDNIEIGKKLKSFYSNKITVA